MQYEIVRLFRYQEWRKRGQEREAEIKLEIKEHTHTAPLDTCTLLHPLMHSVDVTLH